MIGKMPELLEPLEYFRNWNLYEKNLEGYEKVKFYFGDLIKEWVCGTKSLIKNPLENPLEIPRVLDFFNNKLPKREGSLKNFELKIGKDILKAYINELKGQKAPEQIIQKIKSLDFETHVFAELNRNYSNIKKLSNIGDWEAEDKIISVKSILDLDFNYQIIANLLNSFFYIKEYQIIRKYNSIRLIKGKKINYKFRNILLQYLRENIIDVLEKHDKMDLEFPKIGKNEEYNFDKLKITVDTFINPQSEKTIVVYLSYQNGNYSEITIEFKNEINNNGFYGIEYDTNSFWFVESNFNEDYILKRIKDYINKFENGFQNYKGKKSFEGWIALSSHPQDEEYFIKNENEFIDKVKKIRNNTDYKIFLYVIPQWVSGLEKKCIFEV